MQSARRAYDNPRLERSAFDTAVMELQDSESFAVSTWPAGVRLLEQGTRAGGVYLLLSGIVRLSRSFGPGRHQVVTFGIRGTLLGFVSAMLRVTEPVHVHAATTCKVVHYTTGKFREMLEGDHRYTRSINVLLACEANAYLSRLIGLSNLPAKERLESLLNEFLEISGRPENGYIRLELPLKLRELASFVGVTPEHLSRLLRDMERNGVLQRQNGCLIFPQLVK
jgi:CRP-like cAMP-binding protein